MSWTDTEFSEAKATIKNSAERGFSFATAKTHAGITENAYEQLPREDRIELLNAYNSAFTERKCIRPDCEQIADTDSRYCLYHGKLNPSYA